MCLAEETARHGARRLPQAGRGALQRLGEDEDTAHGPGLIQMFFAIVLSIACVCVSCTSVIVTAKTSELAALKPFVSSFCVQFAETKTPKSPHSHTHTKCYLESNLNRARFWLHAGNHNIEP